MPTRTSRNIGAYEHVTLTNWLSPQQRSIPATCTCRYTHMGCSRSSLFHGSSLPEDQPLSMLTFSKVGFLLPACNKETIGEVHPWHILQTNWKATRQNIIYLNILEGVLKECVCLSHICFFDRSIKAFTFKIYITVKLGQKSSILQNGGKVSRRYNL